MTSETQRHGDIGLGIVRGISYGLFGSPDSFVPQMRGLGSTLVRLYLYWGQVEPEPGRYDWSAVDAFLGQLDGTEEVWVTVCSSSPWGTRQPTDFLPPSPALNDEAYSRFVGALVAHCAGRVNYWQCNNEPSNVGLLWAGTAPEYVAQLQSFYRAVQVADPDAAIVLGGCGYDVLSSPAESPARRFFDHVIDRGRDAFDLFSVHLYDDPRHIPSHVDTARRLMRAHGVERPIVVGEYNGPTLFEFPEAQAAFEATTMAAFSGTGTPDLSTGALATQPHRDPPDRRAMKALYARMTDLPPQLQMFMQGCPRELEEKRHRINRREIVTRNLWALSAGAVRTACWSLAPEVPNYHDPYNLVGFLSGTLLLMDYEGTDLCVRYPGAETFTLLARAFADATRVTRIEAPDHDHLFAFDVARAGPGALQVLWRDGDIFTGEDDPAETIDWPWRASEAHAVDAFGIPQAVTTRDGQLRLTVSVTPTFVSSESLTGGSVDRQ